MRIRSVAVGCILLAGALAFGREVDAYCAVRDWLVWRYALYAALCGWVALACCAAGYRVVLALHGRALRFSERLLIGFAAGVLLFGLGVFVAGVLGWYGPVFFFAWPNVLLAIGGPRLVRELVSRCIRLARWPRRRIAFGAQALEHGRAIFLGLGVLAVYLQVLTPGNIGFDARWYHLAIAEQYAVQGAIRPFREGWYLGAYPQLATWLYTWAFQLPGDLFDRVGLSAHLELTLFLATVPGVGLLARRIARGPWIRWSGAALFLFPSLLIYDSNLNGGADHVLAFWAIPVALALFSARRTLSARSAVLFGAMASGALLTKYQAVYVVVPACSIALAMLMRARRLPLVMPAFATVLVLTAPHWLKNAVFYGDPLYPLLHDVLPSTPFHAGAADALHSAYFPARFLLTGSVLERLEQALPVLFTFSFRPHNWPGHGIPQPTFGSLFTLLSLALPFVPRARRLWLLTAATYVGVFIWFWTNHQDRFLQALVPWMAACVVATAARVWALGAAPRIAICALVALQLAWGADAFFYANHRMLHAAPIASLASFVRQHAKDGDAARRFHVGNAEKLGPLLPKDAVVLAHGAFVPLGIDRAVVTDQYGFQGMFGYRELATPRAVWARWRALGVTHLIWPSKRPKKLDAEASAREAVFYDAAMRATHARRRAHGYVLATLRAQPPADAQSSESSPSSASLSRVSIQSSSSAMKAGSGRALPSGGMRRSRSKLPARK